VAQTVDEVVIIHRGRLIRHAAMADVETMAAGSTIVRSPTAQRLAELLADAQIEATSVADGGLAVAAPPERVGEIAAEHRIVLHELSVERASLEEVFLELTGDPGERGA
jgi:ABC-2 type transport system ATP-binding protein